MKVELKIPDTTRTVECLAESSMSQGEFDAWRSEIAIEGIRIELTRNGCGILISAADGSRLNRIVAHLLIPLQD
jgi:hypothetical protein